MSVRDTILAAIPAPKGDALPEPFAAPQAEQDLKEAFAQALAALGAELVPMSALGQLAGKTAYADANVPETYLAGLTRTNDPWVADVGFTMAEAGVAETGTLLLKAGPEKRRLGSLAPPHHVAFLREDQIVPHLEAAFGMLDSRTGVFITGPSRTADIEGVLVRGIHGPGKLWVVLVSSS